MVLLLLFIAVNAQLAFGAPTPKAGYDIIIVAGQSNSVGYGCGPFQDVDRSHDDRIFQIFPHGSIDNASEPLTFLDGGKGGKGFAMTFARLYAAQMPSNRRILLVPAGLGGTSILQWDDKNEGFDFSSATNNLDPIPKDSDLLFRRLKNSTQWAMRAGFFGTENRIVAILWHQGETDMSFMYQPTQAIHQAMPNIKAYHDRLHDLVQLFRQTLGAEVPVVVGEVGRFLDPPFSGANGVSEFNKMLHEFSLSEKSVSVATAEGLENGAAANCSFTPLPNGMNDPVHFNAQSQVEFGRRYFKAYQKMLSPPVR